MIPVTPQPEPADFDQLVRKPGHAYLITHPHAATKELPPYWQKTTKELWQAYSGICAYLAVYFDFTSGAASTDHFIPKSSPDKRLAYEWSNYRLSCLGENRAKGTKHPLDPFELRPNSFVLNQIDGSILPNADQDKTYQKQCQETIDALNLNAPNVKDMRMAYLDEYLQGHVDLDYMKRKSPFIYSEIDRQHITPMSC